LTQNQILLLKSTLELFDQQDDLTSLAKFVLARGENVEFIISRQTEALAAALAIPLGGSPKKGVVVLFSKNLFDNNTKPPLESRMKRPIFGRAVHQAVMI
jgi:hypothetical protein